jgi:hypothetical protein
MLLVAEWDDHDPAGTLRPIDQPDPDLGAARFFADLVGAVVDRTPGGEHNEVRLRLDGDPWGGLPEPGLADIDDLDVEPEDEF